MDIEQETIHLPRIAQLGSLQMTRSFERFPNAKFSGIQNTLIGDPKAKR